jgi:hypothetical protein
MMGALSDCDKEEKEEKRVEMKEMKETKESDRAVMGHHRIYSIRE